ncbi:MAG: site-specific DNA-methyltransferase [Patescibacteria group bacterium]|jgi:site-specific DNA-methyltransferase (adenine-specific)
MLSIEDFKNSIICGDCLDVMKDFPDKSIDLTVTSPPYDNLRTYNGFSFDFEGIAKELFRITKEGGVVVWVVGDATIKGSETGTSFKQALYFKEIGFNLHDTMIYAKNNPIPLTHNRYEQQFEYMFVFSKGKPKTFNGIVENCKTAGKNLKSRTFWQDKSSTEREQHTKDNIVRSTKLIYNIWYYSVGVVKNKKHPAPFPDKLANDHILSWSNEADVVLDPFSGSGTTCKMAKLNNRNYIGIDYSSEYCKISEDRINNV